MKHLVYKTKDNQIHICTPANKTQIQEDLRKIDKITYINKHNVAGEFEVGRNMPRTHHDRRIEWAKNVVDFHNLTDAEFQTLIECDAQDGHQYKFWITHENLPKNDIYRDAWLDIDSNGSLTYDPIVAKTIALKILISKVKSARLAVQDLMDSGDDISAANEAHLKAAQMLIKVKNSNINNHQDVISILKPITENL